jgi:hypothetical protein
MPSRDYKIRVAVKVPEATSEAVSGWLDEALAGDGKLAVDPGAGPELIGFRLDAAKVVELANKKRERVPVVLRRLIATHATLPPAEREEKTSGAVAAELLPDKVLPIKQSYRAEDMLSFVRGLDKGLALAYRRVYGLAELPAAATPEEDRELAGAMAEAVNRRAPKWLIENADLAKLCVAAMRWGMAQTDELDREVKQRKRQPHLLAVEKEKPAGVVNIADAKEMKNEDAASAVEAVPVAATTDELIAHMAAPAQREGEF